MKKTITGMIVIKAVSALAIIASACLLAANAMGAAKLNILQAVIAVTFFIGCLAFWIIDDAKKKNIKFKSSIPAIVILLLAGCAYVICFTPPQVVLITTGRYGQGTAEQNEVVDSVLGEEYAKERFELYFQWYNVLHETGHSIIWFNRQRQPDAVDAEQLVNDFAVAFWAYYGENEKFNDLKSTVAYALENIKRPVDESITYIDYARDNWGKNKFFTFNNYGWFQFSCINNSLREMKPLESVLAEMGVKNIQIQPQKTLVYPVIGEDTASKIIGDAVSILREWGAVVPEIYHTFDNDPNKHMIQIKRNIFGYLDMLYEHVGPVGE